MTTLYEQDFHAWCFGQVGLLKQRQFNKIDLEHLIEEMISVGNREKTYLESNLIVLFLHLLKWKYQKSSYIFEYQSNSWLNSIKEHRKRVARILFSQPSLKSWLPEEIQSIYESAAYEAYKETGLSLETFERKMPWTLDDALTENWLPEEGERK